MFSKISHQNTVTSGTSLDLSGSLPPHLLVRRGFRQISSPLLAPWSVVHRDITSGVLVPTLQEGEVACGLPSIVIKASAPHHFRINPYLPMSKCPNLPNQVKAILKKQKHARKTNLDKPRSCKIKKQFLKKISNFSGVRKSCLTHAYPLLAPSRGGAWNCTRLDRSCSLTSWHPRTVKAPLETVGTGEGTKRSMPTQETTRFRPPGALRVSERVRRAS
jgi:hypothetical protein